jgi:hypothetical protein
MINRTHLTIGQIAEIYGVPAWKIRRVVDSIGADIPRIGLYRCVPRDLLGTIVAELQRQGWFPAIPLETAGL